MGVRLPFVFSTTIVGSIPASGAEAIIITTPPINQPLDGASVLLIGWMTQVIGTGGTQINAKFRRGTTTASPALNLAVVTQVVTAGNQTPFSFSYVDANPGIVAGQQYSLGIALTGATGASSTLDAFMAAIIL